MWLPAKGEIKLYLLELVNCVMVIVNVHFEPDLLVRDLRERLRLISNQRPRSPEAFGVLIGDLNLCDPEEGKFNINKPSLCWGRCGQDGTFLILFPAELHEEGCCRRWHSACTIKNRQSLFFQSSHGWSAWFSLFFSRNWQPRRAVHTERSCCCPNSRAENDRTLRQSQANPELDVQTSRFLHHFEADQWQWSVPGWPFRRPRRLQSYPGKGAKTDTLWTPSQHTR